MIQINSITKSYANFVAVNDVSFIVPSCSITALVGLNGAGKTTLLKAISSIHYADKGTIFVNGINAEEAPEINKSQIGFVEDNARFFPDMSVFDYIYHLANIHFPTFQKKQLMQKVEQSIQLCSLESVLYKNIKTLSKGFKQRLSFAKALVHDPSILLLDEPTSGLDPLQIVEMRNLILRLKTEKTILISTHLMQEVEALCTNIAILHEGVLLTYDSMESIRANMKEESIEEFFVQLISKGTTR